MNIFLALNIVTPNATLKLVTALCDEKNGRDMSVNSFSYLILFE